MLLRFPGACGVRDFLRGDLKTVAHPRDEIAYFTTRTFEDVALGSSLFGTLVIFDPARLPLVRLHGSEHVYLGPNPELELETDVTWVPPRLVASVSDWSPYDRPEKVRSLCGPAWEEERAQMRLKVNAYFEEISALARAGIPFPKTSWYATPQEERARLLKQAVPGAIGAT